VRRFHIVVFALAVALVLPALAGARARHTEGTYLVARVQGPLVLRDEPFGLPIRHLGRRTEFGSPQMLAVVRGAGGRWLGVTSPAAPNGRLAWVDARSNHLRYSRVRLRLDVDLSRRVLSVLAGGRLVRSFPVGIGRPGAATPIGRFAVTDKLQGAGYGPYYGCCILALSGHQPHTPAGWRGGNRLAIHGGGLGAVSAGCVHGRTEDLRFLMRTAPLGTPVFIHP
jgi:hypothetical protein